MSRIKEVFEAADLAAACWQIKTRLKADLQRLVQRILSLHTDVGKILMFLAETGRKYTSKH